METKKPEKWVLQMFVVATMLGIACGSAAGLFLYIVG